MLESTLKFQRAFKRLGERDTKFAFLVGGIPKIEEWDNARVFMRFLKIFMKSLRKCQLHQNMHLALGVEFLNTYKSSLTPNIVKALISVQNWLRSTPVILKNLWENWKR
ncbi:hypothetical protein CR513_46485, partial [Mucuna pruriens]